jgi:hypothetical protein
MVALMAWFSISNHCALGALVAVNTKSATGAMHCHSDQPSPANNSDQKQTPCCKLLRATLAKTNISPTWDASAFVLQQYFVASLLFADQLRHASSLEELDTGPPFAVSFAESVLQHSVLAHAPPLSLS